MIGNLDMEKMIFLNNLVHYGEITQEEASKIASEYLNGNTLYYENVVEQFNENRRK